VPAPRFDNWPRGQSMWGRRLELHAVTFAGIGQVGYEMTLLVERVGGALAPSRRETSVAY